ncbi:ABC transporter permease [Ilumatobacter sp.]|uniref:ABC transporter permease n=1 Tax=Ilumatobacter sp. TaxID=1967498 RepID=UPI003B518421
MSVVADPRPRRARRDEQSRTGPTPTLIAGLVVAAVFAIPAVFVIVRTVGLGASWSETMAEIGSPAWRTLQLAALVSSSAAVVGTSLAWIVERTDLPFRRTWRAVLVLPLVLPSFVGAGAFIAGLAPGGIVHDGLDLVGLTPPRRFRGLGASWLVLTAFTYPYVLMPVAAALASVRANLEEGARTLGSGPFETFARVTLPSIRSSVLAGTLLVFLYTLSEFGAVQLLGYDTLTRVVFTTRQADRSTSFAAAAALLVLAVIVVAAERRLRGRAVADDRASTVHRRPVRLGWWSVPATVACATVAAVGLVVPVASLLTWTLRGLGRGAVDLVDLAGPAVSTSGVAVLAAVITVVVVSPIAVETTRRPSAASSVAASAVLGGFAVPGLVIALALAVIALNAPGLGWLYQSTALLVAGYVIHFGSQALASSEQAVRAVPPRIREQARLLEPSALRRLRTVEIPLMRPGLLAGGGLVFLATVKELPATLLLAPVGFTTLATEIWSGFDEGFYAETGAASLVLISVSAVLTWTLVLRPTVRASERDRN